MVYPSRPPHMKITTIRQRMGGNFHNGRGTIYDPEQIHRQFHSNEF